MAGRARHRLGNRFGLLPCSDAGSSSGMPPCEPWYILPLLPTYSTPLSGSRWPAGISAGVGGIRPPSYQVIRTGGSLPRAGNS